MALTITDCEVTTNSITVFFSDAPTGVALKNFTVYDPASSVFSTPTLLSSSNVNALSPSITTLGPAAQIVFSSAAAPFSKGDSVMITVSGIPGLSGPPSIAAVVDGKNALRVVNCLATPSSVLVYFSEHLDTSKLNSGGTTDPNLSSNYTIQQGTTKITPKTATYDPFNKATFLELSTNTQLQRGQWILVTVQHVASRAGVISNGGNNTFSTRVGEGEGGGPRRELREEARSVEDAVSYPLLTEQVTFPSSGAGPTTALTTTTRGASLDSRAALAVGDVLGWKANSSDPKGFIGALTQAFSLTDVEGHTEATWNPRTYAVQTDLGGGITGAQASLYTRAKDAVQQSMQLLDGLYPLDPDADPEYVKALREMAKSQMNEILLQFGALGGPSILRVNTYFEILLGQSRPTPPDTSIKFDPDKIQGTLGTLRDTYGIYFVNNPFSNSIEDEQDITNFRVISDYMTSLLQSWISNEQFFQLGTTTPAFFGTQLVLLSRQFSVIAETINEVRFAMDSVFIGPAERQTLLLQFEDRNLPAMFFEDMLQEIQDFVTAEGPRLLQDGGKISVTNNIVPVIKKFRHLVSQAHRPINLRQLPDGYRTVRVKRSLDDLHDQIKALIALVTPVGQQVPPPVEEPEEAFAIASINPNNANTGDTPTLTIVGSGFRPGIQASLTPSSNNPTQAITLTLGDTVFISENLAAVQINTSGKEQKYDTVYDVQLTNPDGTTVLLRGGFTVAGWSRRTLSSQADSTIAASMQALAEQIESLKKQNAEMLEKVKAHDAKLHQHHVEKKKDTP